MEPTPLSRSDAATLIKVSVQRLDQLTREGWISKEGRGRYSLVAVVHGYIDFLKHEERRTSKSAAESRVRDMRADEIAVRIAERTKALVAEAQREALALVDEVAGSLRVSLAALPARVTADLALRRMIEDELNDAFGAHAQRVADRAARLPPAGEPVGPPAPHHT
jgi:phage terminase Nu1 subunit (DNA packaging protein)